MKRGNKRQLGSKGAKRGDRAKKRRPACLGYPEWPLSAEAERGKDYLRKKLGGRYNRA